MNEAQRISFLKSSKLFAEAPDDVIHLIAAELREEVVPKGGDVVRKGDKADRMYLLVSGTASVHEGERAIRTLVPGDGFGEMAMLDGQPRAATITAQEPCTLLSLNQEAFALLVRSRPEVSRAVLLVLTNNIRSNTESMARDFEVRMALERKVQDQLRELADGQLAMIFALSKLAESRDTDTGLHLERVREYCRVLATELALRPEFAQAINAEFIELVYRASPLHDIGKVAIPDNILRKPARLTPEEFAVMRTHAELGGGTLRQVAQEYPGNRLVSVGIEIAEGHHEKWDGTGYPRGLSGVAIPLPARIVALADVFDALTSRRPYKEPFSVEEARRLILEGRGSHFDPAMVDAFITVEGEFHRIAAEMGDAVSG
jgi:response regulator RpfG family c-di-GMP phosphodiesterase